MALRSGNKKSGGLSARTFGGLNKKRYASKGGNFDRLQLEKDKPLTIQFVARVDDSDHWMEYDIHRFQEKGRWNYVPCLGDGCPLCDDEDSDVASTSYCFLGHVYSFKDKAIKILVGPKTLADKIAMRYEKAIERGKPGLFLNRTYEVTKMDTTPVSYDIDTGDEDPVRISERMKMPDLQEYIANDIKRFYGEDAPAAKKKTSRTALDDDDDEEEYEDDEDYTKAELMDMDAAALKRVARDLKIATTDRDGNRRNRSQLVKLILRKQG